MMNEQHPPHNQSNSTPELEQQVLAAVLRGVPSLRLVSAQKLADEYAARHTSPDAAVDELIRDSATWNFTTGFMTGLGGVITMAVAIPAALMSSLAIQLRMVATIAALYGHDIDSDCVQRKVIFTAVANTFKDIFKGVGVKIGNLTMRKTLTKLPGTFLQMINKGVGFRLATKFGSKGMINLMNVVPVAGGLIGGSIDAVTCKIIGDRAKQTFRPVSATC
jgi:uncharacterized protein (DUF697 family)